MPGSHRPSVRAKRYVVSSLHYLATMGGVRILENGGNAADAGVAVGICINVLQPGSTILAASHRLSIARVRAHPLKPSADSDAGQRRQASTTSGNITGATCPPEFCEPLHRHRPMRG